MTTKDQLLGMSHGTASHQLRKSIIFWLAKSCNMLNCFRCSRAIELVTDLSIEHKEPWQSAQDPRLAFFDLNNIAFSHLKCNVAASPRNRKYDDRKTHKRLFDKKRYRDPERMEKMRRYRRDYYQRNK